MIQNRHAMQASPPTPPPTTTPSPKTYLVGGAVRDALLGLPVGDLDYVVVGSTTQAMLDAGFKSVGKDFPVFLHPKTHCEYALARTERKSGHGYAGFAVHAAPEVTLEDDLARRDLTMNAIAQAPDGSLIDPYGGAADIAAGVFRHISPAFAEDPVRILRIARFAARFERFTVAPETLALMRGMVAAGEVGHLVAERVWQELSRGLLEAAPLRMFEVLDDCGALAVLLPELKALQGVPQPPEHHPEIDTYVHTSMVLARAAQLCPLLTVRFAALAHDLGKAQTPAQELPRHRGHEGRSLPLIRALCDRLRIPNDCRELALLVAAEHGNIHRSESLNAESLLRLLMRCDAIRQSSRFEQALLACQADAQGRLGLEATPYPQAPRLLAALAAAKSVSGVEVVNALKEKYENPSAERIAQAIQASRVAAIERVMNLQ
jgi:tRNA nucleotidyltransferase (CCA-adding enzyme)